MKNEIDYLRDNIDKLSTREIAEHLKKTELAVYLYMHRYRIQPLRQNGRNLMLELLKLKFGNPEYFMPNKKFYQAVRITQKRWWNLYFGRDKINQDEYLRLCTHLQISLQDAFDARQLKLFDND